MTPTVTVITPCRNAERWIASTMRSVQDQSAFASGRAWLQYLVCDGASTDDTVRIAKAMAGPGTEILSEPDSGMYEALAKGFRLATGEVTGYLNAGDAFGPGGLDAVLDVFESTDEKWITGLDGYFSRNLQIVRCRMPFRYRRAFFDNGFYGTLLPHVQQESTLWRSELNALIDLDTLASYQLAGDSYIWQQFAQAARLAVVQCFIGGFTYHGDHLSEAVEEYRAELQRTCRRATSLELALGWFDRLVWQAPDRVKEWLNPDGPLSYDPKTGGWS